MKTILIVFIISWLLYKKGVFAEIINACEFNEPQPARRPKKPAPAPAQVTPAAPVYNVQPAPVQVSPAPVYNLTRDQMEAAAIATLRKKGYKKVYQIAGSVADDVLRDIINDTY